MTGPGQPKPAAEIVAPLTIARAVSSMIKPPAPVARIAALVIEPPDVSCWGSVSNDKTTDTGCRNMTGPLTTGLQTLAAQPIGSVT